MKKKNLSPLMALAVSFQLMVSPLVPTVYAAENPGNTAAKIDTSIEALKGLYNVATQRPSASYGQFNLDTSMLNEQQTSQADKYFNSQKLMQIPGLGEYLAKNGQNPGLLDCRTLGTTLYEARPEVCRLGVTNDKGIVPADQLSQMFSYYNSYFQVSKMYQNYSADSNADGQRFGLGCMNNAMAILNGFFKYRLDSLDKIVTELEAIQANFVETSKADLDALEEAVAVLEGGSDLADKVRSKNPGLFDFSKRFDNPACNSMFAGETINDLGKQTGLNSINKEIRKTLKEKNGFSGESYAQSHKSVVDDINNMSDKIAKQFELNFNPNMESAEYSKFVASSGSLVSSSTGIEKALRADLFLDSQMKFNEQSNKLTEERQLALTELGSKAGQAMTYMRNKNSTAFESELVSIENNIKNECLSASIGSTEQILSKIYDPSASKHANKNASNFLRDKLRQILSNDTTSIEHKLLSLKQVEQEKGNRYLLKMENSYQYQELNKSGNLDLKTVSASTKRTPSAFLNDIVKNCNAQFKVNKLGNKLSGQSAIDKLRTLNKSYKDLARNQAADIKKDIRKKLVECSSPTIANNTVPGSCTSDLFNPSTPGFCANAALSCSQNMQACSKKAEEYVTEIRNQKTLRTNNYNGFVLKNKKDMLNIFDTTLSRYIKEGEAMRGLFGTGFSSPKGIEREVPEGSRYLSSFSQATSRSEDGKLLLEDPDKYLALVKGNIEKLKVSVKNQQDQILGGEGLSRGRNPGLLADHIKKTEENYSKVASQAEKIADQCLKSHDQAVRASENARNKQMEDEQKLNSELGEQIPKFCRRFETGRINPGPACGGSTDDLVKAALTAASKANNQADIRSVREYIEMCEMSGGNGDVAASESIVPVEEMCKELEKTGKNGPCKAYYKNGEECISDLEVTEGTKIKKGKDCKDLRESIAIAFNYQMSGTPIKITSASPSFCNSGSNSYRGTDKSVLQMIDQFSQGVKTGTDGH